MSNSSKLNVIKRYIFFKIQSGDWNTGVPSIGEIAIRFGVSKSYIQRIYKHYVDVGLFTTIKNKGFFINDGNKIFNEIMEISFSSKSYKDFETREIDEKIRSEIKNKLKFFNTYKYVEVVSDESVLGIYFNYHIDFVFDNPTALLKHFSLNNIIIKKENKYYYKDNLLLVYEDESQNVQVMVDAKYNRDNLIFIDEKILF